MSSSHSFTWNEKHSSKQVQLITYTLQNIADFEAACFDAKSVFLKQNKKLIVQFGSFESSLHL